MTVLPVLVVGRPVRGAPADGPRTSEASRFPTVPELSLA